jgi:glycosyltransferase involved in cell wall biosynthesis
MSILTKCIKQTFIIIPIFNEAQVIEETLAEIKNSGFKNIIVVDDGSSDNTRKILQPRKDIYFLRHLLNRGKGAATITGIEAAKKLNAQIAVTMDGDGQHDPGDISNLIKPIYKNYCDITLGTRSKLLRQMPLSRILGNHTGNLVTWVMHGLWVKDSQSGFRAYSKKALEIMKPQASRYEFDSEIIREIKLNQLTFKEVPIQVRYTDYSMGKAHKQNFINGIKTVYRMVWNLLN